MNEFFKEMDNVIDEFYAMIEKVITDKKEKK